MMTEKELQEVVNDLRTCHDLLRSAGEAFQAGDEDDMMIQLAAMAPRLEESIFALEGFLEGRIASTALDVETMDEDLFDVPMTWGETRTPKKSRFVADEVCMAIRSICEEEFLSQVDEAQGQVDSTERGLAKMWEKMIQEPRVTLRWTGVNTPNMKAIFEYGPKDDYETVSVDAHRLASLRALTLFEKAELSLQEPESVVLCRAGEETPVAAIVVDQ